MAVDSPPPEGAAPFLFVTCQVGAEVALKAELARERPDLHLAFSRPGFLTLKRTAPEVGLPPLRAALARAWGESLGRVAGEDVDALAREAWRLAGPVPYQALHVWSREAAVPGEHDFEPGPTPEAALAEAALRRLAPPQALREAQAGTGRVAGRGQRVLDCVLVDPGRWWLGRHRAESVASRFPGGDFGLELPPGAVSRAWLKTTEALRWSRLPVESGDLCVELGSSPGGSSQALLARGLRVVGIDPAEMAPEVLTNAHFHHVRKRASDLPRREFRDVRWLLADMNLVPTATLQAVEDIVTHEDVHVRGLLLNLKLREWDLVEGIPDWLARIHGWGYRHVQVRQLVHQRQEVCVAALRHRALLRVGRKRRPARRGVPAGARRR